MGKSDESPPPPPPQAPTEPALDIKVEEIDYVAFEGGAAFGMAYPSALLALQDAFKKVDAKREVMEEDAAFKWPVKGVSGTSIGASFAYFFALGYSPKEITDIAVRDGFFAKIFDEQFEIGRNLAAAYDPEAQKTRIGWYGDKRLHRSDGKDLNKLLKASSTVDYQDDYADGWFKMIGDANFLDFLESEAIPNFVKTNLNLLTEWFGIPDSQTSLKQAYSQFIAATLFDAILKLFGSPKKKLDEISLERLAKQINLSATEKMRDKFPFLQEASIGSTSMGKFVAWAPLIIVVLSLMLAVRSLGPSGGEKGRGGKYDFLNPQKLDELQRNETAAKRAREANETPKRDRTPFWYNFKLLRIAIWKNLLTDQNFQRHWKQAVRIGMRLTRLLRKKEHGDGELDEFFQKANIELVKLAWCVIWSPITHLAWKSLMQDGGLLNGQKIRDLLAFATFNKCSILPSDEALGWRLVRRPETLIDTLNRLIVADRANAQRKFSEINESLAKTSAERANARRKTTQAERFTDIDQDLFDAFAMIEMGLRKSSENGLISKDEWLRQTRTFTAVAASAKLQSQLHDFPQPKEVADQFKIIEEDLTFERLHDMLDVEIVVTSGSYSESTACYWRRSLTPDFPVIEAVRTAGAFPVLFKPSAIYYRPADPAKGYGSVMDGQTNLGTDQPCRDGGVSRDTLDQIGIKKDYSVRDWFYDSHYRGYFADAGIFNNLPINAFNGLGINPDQEKSATPDPAEYLLPHETLQTPFNKRVLGFELTNDNMSRYITRDRMYRPPASPFIAGYTQRKGLKTVLNNQLRSFPGVLGNILNGLYSMSGRFRRLDPKVNRAIIPVVHGNVGMFDMHPDLAAIRDSYEFNIRRVTHALTGYEPEPSELAGALKELFGEHRSKWDELKNLRWRTTGLDKVI